MLANDNQTIALKAPFIAPTVCVCTD